MVPDALGPEVAWVLVAFGAVTVSASVPTTCPPWARIPAAALAGVVNAWIWVRIVDAVRCRRAVLPLDTGVTVPPADLRVPHIVVPSFHGGAR